LGFDIITFGGGDAFSKKHFREACTICKSHGVRTHSDTNCISIKPYDYKFIIENIDLLGISLDGIGLVHDMMRKSNNLFSKVDSVLLNLEKQNFKVKINTVVTKKNKNDLNNIYNYLKKFTNIQIWSLYQFFPLDAAKKHQENFKISDQEFDSITEPFQNTNFNIEKFKFSDRVSGYIFCDEIGNLYTNGIDANYLTIGSIYDNTIIDKLQSLNLSINPKVEYRY
jgi:MoaA/NifB/PqqE/SkfB family radical SAM enzyme